MMWTFRRWLFLFVLAISGCVAEAPSLEVDSGSDELILTQSSSASIPAAIYCPMQVNSFLLSCEQKSAAVEVDLAQWGVDHGVQNDWYWETLFDAISTFDTTGTEISVAQCSTMAERLRTECFANAPDLDMDRTADPQRVSGPYDGKFHYGTGELFQKTLTGVLHLCEQYTIPYSGTHTCQAREYVATPNGFEVVRTQSFTPISANSGPCRSLGSFISNQACQALNYSYVRRIR